MEKSVDAFRTISEVADELDLPQHVLRFWETRFTQIRPLKRAGGRRYYRPADVVLLRNIRQLLYDDGYTIKGVQRLLKDKTWLKENSGREIGDTGDTAQDSKALDAAVARDTNEPDTNDSDVAQSPSEGFAALTQAPAPSAHPSRDELRDALAAIEDCQRILAEVLGRKD